MNDYIKSFFPETQPIEIPTDYEIARLAIEKIDSSFKFNQ